ncbi:MAG: tetratricopeptide repeat protein [Saprospiraceae bacterium]|nr:tetratricopeptide repeat protein [Saprospiraceae bacterium]
MLLGFIIIYSCSTKKNSFTRRSYHNLTSHYNGYFNGNESLKEGVALISKSHIDDYNNILSVFTYGDEQAAQSAAPNMDKAIKKASVVIQRHSMFFRKKEQCKWIDDAYLLMGKAHFYKGDYMLAKQTFIYIASHFSYAPIKYDAMLWQARIANIEGEYDKAQSLLDAIQNRMDQGGVSKTVKKDFPLVYADHYIRQENYPPAIEYLLAALDSRRKKDVKIRISYILAQIYVKSGRCQDAVKYYRKVIKMNPPYEIAFHSKISMARCFDAEKAGSRDIKKLLLKMVKDEKNKEYLDEIYFALAQIEIKEKNKPQAIEYLQLSVITSVNNNYQKAISSLTLADIYFEKLDYPNAQAYYDSTMIFLPKDWPEYNKIKDKKETLTDLVTNLIIVQTEDSLQNLANMSAAERNKIIDGIIEKIVEEERRKQQEEIDRQQSLQFLDQTRRETGSNQASGAQWYFYNTASLSFGFSEFAKKWGNRKLEDLWRLSNKQSVSYDFGDGNDMDGDGDQMDSSKLAKANLKDRNLYLKNIPLTKEAKEKSDLKIAKALFKLGVIYFEGLKDYDKAIETFEELDKRFPQDEHILKSYYQLYRIYKELDYDDDAKKYKDLIIRKYPDSDYANFLKDPDYFRKQLAEKDKAKDFYKTTYLAYSDGKYSEVIANCNTAIKEYQDTMLIPKFDYLRAISIGKTSDTATFISELRAIVEKYPKSNVRPLAQNIIDFYTAPKKEKVKKTIVMKSDGQEVELPTDGSPYIFDEGAIHLFVSIVEIKKISMNEFKIGLSDFNRTVHSLKKLTVSTIFLDKTHQIVTVSNFKSSKLAEEYINSVLINKDLEPLLEKGKAQSFIISVGNYSTWYKNKDIEGYLEFYKEYYHKD